jgi:hypothetical protein
MADNKVQATARALEATNQEISETERALGREIELRKAGMASNVQTKQKELADLKKLREQEEKDHEKAVRAKQNLESVQQLVSMITASANIFKVLSPAGPIGVALAVSTIGVMFAAFAAAKAQAAKAAKYAHGGGGVVDGPSHAQGGVYVPGVGEVEGGEWFHVVNRDSTRKHLPLLQAINRDDQGAIAREAAKTQPRFMNFGVREEVFTQAARSVKAKEQQQQKELAHHIHVEAKADNENLVKEIKGLRADLNMRTETTHIDGQTIIRKGNHTRIIRE